MGSKTGGTALTSLTALPQGGKTGGRSRSFSYKRGEVLNKFPNSFIFLIFVFQFSNYAFSQPISSKKNATDAS